MVIVQATGAMRLIPYSMIIIPEILQLLYCIVKKADSIFKGIYPALVVDTTAQSSLKLSAPLSQFDKRMVVSVGFFCFVFCSL